MLKMAKDILMRIYSCGISTPEFALLEDAANEISNLRTEREKWERVARSLARELGKEEYADAEYENQGLENA